MKYVGWLWHNTLGIRWNTAVRIVSGIGQVMLGLLMVWFSKRFIDETIRTGSTDDVLWMILWLVATVMGGIVFRQIYYYLTVVANTRQTNTLRLQMFSNLFRRQLYNGEELHSGDITSRLAKDIEVVCSTTTDILPQLFITGIQLSGSFLLLRYFDKRLAWALLLLTPLAIVFGKLVARRLRQMTLDIRHDESRIQMHVQEGMEHNAVLRSLGSEQWVTDRLDGMQERLKGNVMRRTRFTVVTRLVLGSAFGLGYLLAFVWGGLQLRAGVITFGVMTSFLQLVGQIQSPILQLLNMVPALIHSTASIDRLEDIDSSSQTNHPTVQTDLQTGCNKSRISNSLQHEEIDSLQLGLKFDNVSFRYATGDRQILSHFTHDFKAGTKTAILGETGIGKTTLFRLILGLIEPTEGSVKIYSCDGDCKSSTHDIQITNSAEQVLCFVPQGNTLMSGTIRYNLQLAKPDATDEELKQVLHTACADFVLELPEGLNTELGERGSGLSEGQAQRIAIARGLLRPGNILLLDEISSSLDEPTERELYRRLFEAFPNKTMLFITHRLTVTEQCDEMVRL